MAAAAAVVANSALFREAVEKYMSAWPALQLAIQHQTSGAHTVSKARWLVGVILGYFADNDDLCPGEVSDFIGDIMDVEFDVYVEDGTLEQLGQDLIQAFRLVASSQEQQLRARIDHLPPANLANVSVVLDSSQSGGGASASGGESTAPEGITSRLANVAIASSSSSSSSQNHEGPTRESSEPMDAEDQVDDGWTVVTKAGKRR